MKKSSALLLILTGLSACADPRRSNLGSQENPSSAVMVPGATCPPAGTTVTRDNGQRLAYRGYSLVGVGVCSIRTSTGVSDVIGAIVPVDALNVVQRSQALAQLFPLASGKTATSRYRNRLANSIAENSAIVDFEETWTVRGERAVQVGEQARPAWILERTEKNMWGSNGIYIHTFAIDKENGVPLSYARTIETRSDVAPLRWRVVDLQLPAPSVSHPH